MFLNNRRPNFTGLAIGAAATMATFSLMPSASYASAVNLFYEHFVPEFVDSPNLVEVNEILSFEAKGFVEQDVTFDTKSPCCVTGSARNVFKRPPNAALEDDEFGSHVELFTTDSGPDSRVIIAGGHVLTPVALDPGPITELSFGISNTRLSVSPGTRASLKFDITLRDLTRNSADIYPVSELASGPVLAQASYEAAMVGITTFGSLPDLNITQTGFDTPLPEPDFVEINSTFFEWDIGAFDATMDLLAAGIEFGDSFVVDYTWDVVVSNNGAGSPNIASASFFDPVNLEGGLSLDKSNLTLLQVAGATTPLPSAVPLPAGFFLLLSGGLIPFLLRFGRRRPAAQ